MYKFTGKMEVELRDLTKTRRRWLVVGICCFIVSISLSIVIKNYYMLVCILPLLSLVVSYNKLLHRKTLVTIPISMQFNAECLTVELLYAIVKNRKGYSISYLIPYGEIHDCNYRKNERVLSLTFSGKKSFENAEKEVKKERLEIPIPEKIEKEISDSCERFINIYREI